MKISILITMLFALAACGNNSVNAKKEVVALKAGDDYYALDASAKKALNDKNSKEQVVCTKTHRVGTNFKDKRCSTRAQIKADRQNSQDFIRRNSEAANRAITNSHKGN